MELASLTDQMVAVCEWLLAALVANGLPAARLSLVRQGLAAPAPATIGQHVRRGDHVRLAYLGRCTEVKGIDVAIAALRALDNERGVTLDLHFAEPTDGSDAAYARRLRRLAAGDARIRFAGPLSPPKVTQALRAFDIVVVSSRVLETGPLVALEALSAGAVVVGSDRGGIAELARIYPGIRLAPADDIDAWARALRDAIDAVRRRETRPCMPVRTMDEVAADMLPIYEAAMAHARAAGRLVGAVS
jgi:glycosyltransferase involved in cell wall biosynthesis